MDQVGSSNMLPESSVASQPDLTTELPVSPDNQQLVKQQVFIE